MTERNTRIRASQITSIYPSDIESTNVLGSAMDGYVPTYDLATGKFTWVELPTGTVNQADLDRLSDNIVLNAFRTAINGSLAQFNMIDGIVDEYEDESGIDTTNSVNQSYDQTDDYYANLSTGGGIDTYTELMIHADNLDTATPRTLTFSGNAQLDTAQYKFGVSSLLMDGSGDLVTLNSSTGLIIGTSDCTIECWVRCSDITNVRRIISTTVGGTSSSDIIFRQEGANFRVFFGSTALVSSGGISANTWHHLSCVRNGSNVYLYIDGTQVASGTNSDNITNYIQYIGGYYNTTEYFYGWIDSIRISKGTARYTSAFTPSTSEFTTDQYTTLLCHFNGSDTATSSYDSSVGDVSGNDHQLTYNADTQIDTAQFKFGVSSLFFDGTGDYISIPDSDDWDFGTGDFTIDFWAYRNASCDRILSIGDPWSTNGTWAFYCNSTGRVGFYLRDGSGTSVLLQDNSAGFTNSWMHIAVVRNGNTWTLYTDGTVSATTTSSITVANSTLALEIGRSASYYFNGWIDELRISKGIARWTSAFTPPTSQYSTSPVSYNMELLSNSFTAEAQPDSGRIVILEEDVDTITLNTDLKAWASRDGGSTWAQGTLSDEGDYDSTKRVLVADFDFTASGLGTGTSMKYKLTSHNNKELKLHGSGLSWD